MSSPFQSGIAALLTAALVGTVPAPARAARCRPENEYVSGADAGTRACHRRVHVKFRDGTAVRLRGGRLVTVGGDDLSGLTRVLAPFGRVRVERLFSTPEAVLARERARLEETSGRELADLNLYYRLTLPPGGAAAPLIASLRRLDIVESAYPEPRPPPPPQTPSFVALQGYRHPAPDGIGADVASSVLGGSGENVTIADVEYGWNRTHEDLDGAGAPEAVITNGSPCDPFSGDDHGTAAIGELVADDDAVGVTGVVPEARLRLVNAAVSDGDACVWDLADAIHLAFRSLTRGDVLLVEQQVEARGGGFVPVEWVPAVYDAISFAIAAGIVVVEPAGNGGQDLDASRYGSPFPQGRPDSGAIVVGAGGTPGCDRWAEDPRVRLPFSTYGSRVDLQGWGECVTTTGFGDLYGAVDPNSFYTSGFGGTSSAAAMVAGAAASLSGAIEARTGRPPRPGMVRSRLVATGTSQEEGGAGHIGPLPNLAAALEPERAATVAVHARWFRPRAAAAALGVPVVWDFLEGTHSVTDSAGLSEQGQPLFDSEVRAAPSRYSFVFDAAGSYRYRSTAPGDPDSMRGVVGVPVAAVPTGAGDYTLKWATASVPGAVHLVQKRHRESGASNWGPWTFLPSPSGEIEWNVLGVSFQPPAPGSYQFRSKLKNASTGSKSGWSPATQISAL